MCVLHTFVSKGKGRRCREGMHCKGKGGKEKVMAHFEGIYLSL